MTAPKYSDSFKEQVVLEVIEKDRTIAAVAESYGLVAQTVGNWVKKYRQDHPEPGAETATKDELAEITRLKKDLAEARLENEFLKKAAAFFAKESQ